MATKKFGTGNENRIDMSSSPPKEESLFSLEEKAFSSEVALFTNNQPGGSHDEHDHQLLFGGYLDRIFPNGLSA